MSAMQYKYGLKLTRISILALHWFKYVSLASVSFWTGLDHAEFPTEGSLDFYPPPAGTTPNIPPIDFKFVYTLRVLAWLSDLHVHVQNTNINFIQHLVAAGDCG